MQRYQFSFEKLEVWQLARQVTKTVYAKTASFPQEERYLLTSQMRRAAISIVSNLAEGSARKSAGDKAHFTTIAYSSLMELLNHCIISFDRGLLTTGELDEYRADFQKLSVKLSNLKKSQLRRSDLWQERSSKQLQFSTTFNNIQP